MFRKSQSSKSSGKCMSRATAFRIEQLETRLLFNTYTVTTPGDGAGVVTPAGPGAFDATTLRAAIAAANADAAADTINFASGVVGAIGLNSALPPIEHNLTVAGPGESMLTVETGQMVTTTLSIFEVDAGATATISGLTINGGTGTDVYQNNNSFVDGGGIYNSGTLAIDNCIVSNGLVMDDGGGISNSGTLSISNSTVTGNRCSEGDGGGIYNTGTIQLTNSNVSDNTAYAGTGGGISGPGAITLANCTVSGNQAAEDGAGIDSGGTLTVTGCDVSGNQAQDGAGGINSYGSNDMTLTNCKVTDNSADSAGGIASSGGTMTGCTVTGNTAVGGGGGAGGGLENSGTLAVANCTLSNNSAGNGPGGGIENSGALTLANCSVSQNACGIYGGGGGIDNEQTGSLTVNNCYISANFVHADNGGGIENAGTLKIDNSTIAGNSAVIGGGNGGNGAGISNEASGTLTVTSCTISSNSAANSDGGGVYNDGGPATITTSTLENNSALLDGGGIWTTGVLTVSHSAVNGNTAGAAPGDAGGGIYAAGRLHVDHSTLNADAAYEGGGLFNAGTATITDCTAASDTAFDGAGLYNTVDLSLYGCTIQADAAGDSGGGAYSINGSGATSSAILLTLEGCDLSANSAKNGGGGLFLETGQASVADSIIQGNSALDGAGADAALGNLFFTASTISDNRGPAASGTAAGGGIFNSAGEVSLASSTVSANSAASGAGIYSVGPLYAVNCTLADNNAAGAAGQGGGLWIGAAAARDLLTDCTISGNSASLGGGIFNGAAPILDGNIVAGNTTEPLGKGSPADIAYAVANSSSYDLVGDGSGDLPTGSAYHNLLGSHAHPLDPLLSPLGYYGGPTQTMALLPGSPALDAGHAFDYPNSTQPIATDQRGIARPQGPAPDIGAFESRRLYPYGYTLHATHNVTYSGYLGAFVDDDPQDASPTAFKISINWGDGSSSSGSAALNTSSGNWDVSGSHRYARKGTYAVTITIRDAGGFATTVHSTADVG